MNCPQTTSQKDEKISTGGRKGEGPQLLCLKATGEAKELSTFMARTEHKYIIPML
jgi:hypothetical protein